MPRLTSLSNINPIVGLSAIPYSWQIESRFSLVNTVWDSPSPNASSLAQNADDFTLTADNEILISDGSADKAIAISINGDTFKNMSDGVSPYGGKFYGYQFVKFKGLYVISEHIRSVGDVGGTGMVHVLDSNLTSVKSLDDSDVSAGSFGGGIATDGNYLVITSLKPYTSSYDGLSYKGCLHVYDSNFNEIREIFYGDVVAPLIPGLSRSALENTPLWIYGAGGSATLNMYDGIVYAYSAHLPADSAASVAGVNNEDYNNGVVLRFDVENGTYLG